MKHRRVVVAVTAILVLLYCCPNDGAEARLPEAWRGLQESRVQSDLESLLEDVDPLVPSAWFQRVDDTTVIMAVGTATVEFSQNRARAENNALAGAEATARMEIAQLIYGVEISSTVEIRERTRIRTTESETVIEDLFDTESVTKAVVDGTSQGARTVGTWLSQDRATAGVLLLVDKRIIEESKEWRRRERHGSERDREPVPGPEHEGIYEVRVEGVGSTASAAREDALHEAVKIVFGVIVSERIVVRDTETILRKVRTFSTGYVQDYSILEGPECTRSGCWVDMNVWVSSEALRADVRRLNELMGNPVMAVVEVSDFSTPKPAAGSGIVQWVEQSLLDVGFTPHSFDARSLFERSMPDDVGIAAQIRENHPRVDIVLLVATDIEYDSPGGVHIARVSVKLRALNARTGELLGAVTGQGMGRSLSSESAAVDTGLREGSGKASELFARQIAARWERETMDGYAYLVRVHNIADGQAGAAQIDALRESLELSPGERSVEERHLTEGTLELDVVHDGMIGEVREAIMSAARTSSALPNLHVVSMGGSFIELSIGY